MLRVSSAVAAVMLFVVSSSASAQVIYMPVQVQHGTDMKYYYGGTDPGMHHYADHVACRNGYPNAHTGPHYSSLRHTLGQIGERRLILSDCLPYRNAAVYGYREHDAVNEANASVPLSFRMRDQLDAALPVGDGTFIVPAHGIRHREAHYVASMERRLAPPADIKPRAILILPKKAPKQADTKAVKLVASAR